MATIARKTVRTLAKGQVTIPNQFREALGIGPNTLLDITLVDDHLEIKPLRPELDSIRRYADEDIQRFLEEDRLDEATAARVQELLEHGEL